MVLDALLGNHRLKENLSRSLKKGHISHFYLISGPEGSGRHTLARLLATSILCDGGGCGGCESCRKVLTGTHPDYITVDDPEKKTVPVDLIRQARADIYVHPNEGSHKIYLFPRAQDMGIPGQNALLKVLEEPPKYGVFILLTDNPERLLPTVRSRCTELQLRPVEESTLRRALQKEFPSADAAAMDGAILRSGGFLGQARALLSGGAAILPQTEAFAKGFAEKDTMLLIQTLVPMEKLKRDQLIPLLQQWVDLLEAALASRSGMASADPLSAKLGSARSPYDLMQAISCLQKAITCAQGNVSTAAICSWLSWELC